MIGIGRTSHRNRRQLNLAFVLLSGLAPASSLAAAPGVDAGEAKIAKCIHEAAGDMPWLEKTLWGLRDQEGGWIGAEIRNVNGTHDLGPLQVNSAWAPKIAALMGRSANDVRVWLTWDPCFNVGTARWLFLAGLGSAHDFWKAVGVYHSPTEVRQKRYAFSVARHLKYRFGSGVFAAPSVPHVAPGRQSSTLAAQHQSDPPIVKMHGFGVLAQQSSDVPRAAD